MRHQWILGGLIGLAEACGSSQAVGPQSMTIAQREAMACEGISAADQNKDPFLHGADIRSVSRLRGAFNEAGEDFAGAAVVFRAAPGLTAEWIQRVVDCRLARSAALGSDSLDSHDSPLSVPGASAIVASVGNGFAVEILSNSDKAADEIWRRAQRIPIRR